MLATDRPPETIFELKKDIVTPGIYLRAGTQKTKAEWQELYPSAFQFHSNEWFIDMTIEPVYVDTTSLARKIVNEVFEKKGLHSISYKEAAVASIEAFIKRGTTLGKSFGLNEKIDEEDFRNFIRTNHLSVKWEKFINK